MTYLAAALVVIAVGWWVVRRRPSRAQRLEQRQMATELPLVADLLAVALKAGAPPELAVRTVGVAVDGPVGARLRRVGRALSLGEQPARAWAHLGDLPMGLRLAAAAIRSANSGALLSDAFTRLAEELRTTRLADLDAATRRAGVLIVLPLGLCFLPAFFLTGVVPVVIAVLDGVL